MTAIASKLKKRLKPSDEEERCGLVLKGGRILETVNKHPHRKLAFMIAAKEMQEHGDKLAGTWHTHPGETSALSQDDYMGFSNWPELTHYVVGTDGVRAYRSDEEGLIEEVPCT